jgi:hypothetical protein
MHQIESTPAFQRRQNLGFDTHNVSDWIKTSKKQKRESPSRNTAKKDTINSEPLNCPSFRPPTLQRTGRSFHLTGLSARRISTRKPNDTAPIMSYHMSRMLRERRMQMIYMAVAFESIQFRSVFLISKYREYCVIVHKWRDKSGSCPSKPHKSPSCKCSTLWKSGPKNGSATVRSDRCEPARRVISS